MQADPEFAAVKITKIQSRKAENADDCWRYIMQWERLKQGSEEVSCPHTVSLMYIHSSQIL